jgi:hypothetical protein
MDELYVNYDGLDNNIEELRLWKKGFNEIHNEFVNKLDEMNQNWSGIDYENMKNSLKTELNKITGEDGKIQTFVRERTEELKERKADYKNIQSRNASYWG